MSRRILYVEVPGFYAEVERLADSSLAERPLIVGGNPRKRGLVQSASSEALEAGVALGMQVLEALERCPNARALRTDMPRYREVDKRFRSCLGDISERLEPEGLGAAYLEISHREEGSAEMGEMVRSRVTSQVGCPVIVGVAPVRFVAKIAASESRGIRVVELAKVGAFLGPLDVARLPGVGPNTANRLGELGIHLVAEVVTAGREFMERELGNHGLAIWTAATGQGSDRVRVAAHPRSISQETTLQNGERDREVLGQVLGRLAERMAHHLELEGLLAGRLALKVRTVDGVTITRTRTPGRLVAEPESLANLALDLLDSAELGDRSVRLVGLSATRLTRGPASDAQLPLFPRGD